MEDELIVNAKEELKRIDHLIYVTLKYTRTVDVFLSIIERMINAYEFVVEALLNKAREEGNMFQVEDTPIEKAHKVVELYPSKKVKDNIDFYLLLRKLRRSNYEKSNEFRRHVTMTAIVDDKIVKVNIDSITEDFHKLKDFVFFVEKNYLKND